MTKSPQAFRSISEAAEEVGVPQHVLRFWETKFDFIEPMKRAGGRRFYRPDDVELLKGVRRFLHDDGLTIKGVQRLYKEHGKNHFLEAVSLSRSDSALPPFERDVALGGIEKPILKSELKATLALIEAAHLRLSSILHR